MTQLNSEAGLKGFDCPDIGPGVGVGFAVFSLGAFYL